MANLYMMCGLSATGKTTYAKYMAEMYKMRYVNPDELYAVFNGDECKRQHKFEVWQTLYQIVHCAEVDNASIMIDTNCLTKAQREEIRTRFPGFDNYYLIVITADEEKQRQWNANRHRVVPKDELKRQASVVEWPDFDDYKKGWDEITYFRNIEKDFSCYKRISNGVIRDIIKEDK